MKRKAEKNLEHGGDWAGYKSEYGKDPLDFSMNVNPLGMAPAVKAAVASAAETADRYPDPLCRELKRAVAIHEQVPEEWLFFGNGASEVIFRLALGLENGNGENDRDRFSHFDEKSTNVTELFEKKRKNTRKKLLVTAPTFSEYEKSFAECGWQVDRYELSENKGFRIDEDILPRIDDSCDAVFLCEPNNPTGVTTEPELLKIILDRCREKGIYLLVDECFNGFLDEPEEHSLTGELEGYPKLVILKAFTKLYGMAGIRLGYCMCSDPGLIGRLEEAGPEWNVSTLAQAAGVAALSEEGYVEEAGNMVRTERQWLKGRLSEMGIYRAYGEANYILFYGGEDGASGRDDDEFGRGGSGSAREAIESGRGDETGRADEESAREVIESGRGDETGRADEEPTREAIESGRCNGETPAGLQEKLKHHGILIRDCRNYRGLGRGWYRIAVKTRRENKQLIEALKSVLGQRQESRGET